VTCANGGSHSGSWWFHGKDGGSPVRFRRGLYTASDQPNAGEVGIRGPVERLESTSLVGMRSDSQSSLGDRRYL
jgi:hypothetical protein